MQAIKTEEKSHQHFMLITQRHQRQYLACMHLLTAVLTVHFPERKEKTTSTSLKKFRIKCPLQQMRSKRLSGSLLLHLEKMSVSSIQEAKLYQHKLYVIYTRSKTMPAQIVSSIWEAKLNQHKLYHLYGKPNYTSTNCVIYMGSQTIPAQIVSSIWEAKLYQHK